MTARRQVAFWLAGMAVFGLLLFLLADILLPFVAGMAVAYLLDAGQYGDALRFVVELGRSLDREGIAQLGDDIFRTFHGSPPPIVLMATITTITRNTPHAPTFPNVFAVNLLCRS